MNQPPLASFTQQVIPKLRVRNVDQSQRPLTHVFPVKTGDAIFGNDIVDISPGRHNAGARLQARRDPRGLSVRSRGRQRDDGFAAVAPGGAADEINLAAKAAVKLISDRVSAHLTGQIHLDG
jgi:hypothetical protein